MEAAGLKAGRGSRSAGRRLADLFHGRPRLQVGALLSGPLAWLVILYLGSLAVLLIASFWSVDALSGELIKGFTWDNYKELWNTDVYRTVAFRTIGIASAVTVTDALLAFPIAFYMAKLASPRVKGILVVAVLMPLWSFYLVKVYAWQTMLRRNGIINWALDPHRPQRARVRRHGGLDRGELPLASVHDPADLRGPRAHPGQPALRVRGPRRQARSDLPASDPAARLPRRCRRARSSRSR